MPQFLRWLMATAVVIILSLNVPSAQAIVYGGVGGRPANIDPSNPRTSDVFIHTIEPGQSKNDAINVINNSAEKKTLMIYAADFSASSDGGYACSGLFDVQKDLGHWISFQPLSPPADHSSLPPAEDSDHDGLTNQQEQQLSTNPTLADTDGDGGTDAQEIDRQLNPLQPVLIELAAGATRILPFTINVPPTADVGEHDGCIFVQEKKSSSVEQGISLSVRSGVRVMITVPGAITHRLNVVSFTTQPRAGGGIILHPAIKNSGNASVEADVRIITRNIFGRVVKQHGGKYTITRGNTSKWNFELGPQFWGGWYHSTISVGYDRDPQAQPGQPIRQLATLLGPALNFWLRPTAMAWMIYGAGLVVLCILLLLAWVAQQRRSSIKRHWISYQVKKGETLQSLAKRWNVSWQLLAKANRLRPPYELLARQTLKAPPQSLVRKAVPSGTPRRSPAPSRRSGSRRKS